MNSPTTSISIASSIRQFLKSSQSLISQLLVKTLGPQTKGRKQLPLSFALNASSENPRLQTDEEEERISDVFRYHSLQFTNSLLPCTNLVSTASCKLCTRRSQYTRKACGFWWKSTRRKSVSELKREKRERKRLDDDDDGGGGGEKYVGIVK